MELCRDTTTTSIMIIYLYLGMTWNCVEILLLPASCDNGVHHVHNISRSHTKDGGQFVVRVLVNSKID